MSLTKEDVSDAIKNVLDERNRVDQLTHQRHHEFVEMQIEKYKERKRVRESVKKQVIGWGVIIGLSGIGVAVYAFVAAALQKGHGP